MKKVFFILFAIAFTSSAFSQATKPTIIVFPAQVWMSANGYVKYVDNQGSKTPVYDYQRAMSENKEVYAVINKIQGLMKDRGFPVADLGSALNKISEMSALDNMDQNQQGGGIAESPRDKLLKSAKPDIVMEIEWTVIPDGPRKKINFQLKGVDSGTGSACATAGGGGEPSYGDIPSLLEEAVLSHLDNFNSQLQATFDDMFANGRQISLDVRVWGTSPKQLNDYINDDGDLLKDDLKKWVTKNSVKGRFNLTSTSSNMMNFTNVRIPLYDVDGVAFDADGFANNLRKYIFKTYKIDCESDAIGQGTARVYIGGKR